MGTILKELFVAFDCNGNEDFRFSFGRGDVKGDVVEVRDNLINGYGRGSGLRISSYFEVDIMDESDPEKRSVSKD